MVNQGQSIQPTDPDWNAAISYGGSEHLNNAGAKDSGQGQSCDPLRSEALTDFQELHGWWDKIIVRDMLKTDPDSLPRILIL